MFYNFILQVVMMLSLGAIVYIFALALPRIDEEVLVKKTNTSIDDLIKRIPLEKIDESVNNFLQKLLRKVKIGLMRADNVVTARLNKFKPGKKNGTGLPLQ